MKNKNTLSESIKGMKISGREGCTYNDTDYDSLSVCYGYNNALEDVISKLQHLSLKQEEDSDEKIFNLIKKHVLTNEEGNDLQYENDLITVSKVRDILKDALSLSPIAESKKPDGWIYKSAFIVNHPMTDERVKIEGKAVYFSPQPIKEDVLPTIIEGEPNSVDFSKQCETTNKILNKSLLSEEKINKLVKDYRKTISNFQHSVKTNSYRKGLIDMCYILNLNPEPDSKNINYEDMYDEEGIMRIEWAKAVRDAIKLIPEQETSKNSEILHDSRKVTDDEKEQIENNFVIKLLAKFNENGIDTTTWDGDDLPEDIIPREISILLQNLTPTLSESESTEQILRKYLNQLDVVNWNKMSLDEKIELVIKESNNRPHSFLSKHKIAKTITETEAIHLLYYGHTQDGKHKIETEEWRIDTALELAFNLLVEKTVFEDDVKKLFFQRLTKIANYNSIPVNEEKKYTFKNLCILTSFIRENNHRFDGKGVTNTDIINEA
ncbi:MAG: hypothetical protein AABY22_27775, partial [Nanoarchaeota archaeon]